MFMYLVPIWCSVRLWLTPRSSANLSAHRASLGRCSLMRMPGTFVAIGLNYADHAAESGMPIPAEPNTSAKRGAADCTDSSRSS